MNKHHTSVRWTFQYGYMVYYNGTEYNSHKGLRSAIDAAIRASKKKPKKRAS